MQNVACTTTAVDGLSSGTRVRVLFDDRELEAADGCFVDDFRGQDLYQRLGGGPNTRLWRHAGGRAYLRDWLITDQFEETLDDAIDLVGVQRTDPSPETLN